MFSQIGPPFFCHIWILVGWLEFYGNLEKSLVVNWDKFLPICEKIQLISFSTTKLVLLKVFPFEVLLFHVLLIKVLFPLFEVPLFEVPLFEVPLFKVPLFKVILPWSLSSSAVIQELVEAELFVLEDSIKWSNVVEVIN